MRRLTILIGVAVALGAAGGGYAADHPASDSDCASCHAVGSSAADAPEVMPEQPGFFAKLFGKKSYQGHPSLSCAGTASADGTLTGCHRPEAGFDALLAVDLEGKPWDALCVACHADTAVPGQHHPSYKADKDDDGVAETLVVPMSGEEVFDALAPARGLGDAIRFRTAADGSRQLVASVPLRTVVETVDGDAVETSGVITCSTCHNPHYGYLVAAQTEEELNQDLVARDSGDALLRLKDFDNALCDACH